MVIRDKGLLEVQEAQEYIGFLEAVTLLLHQVIQVVLVDMVILEHQAMEQLEAALADTELLAPTVILEQEQPQEIQVLQELPEQEQLPEMLVRQEPQEMLT